MRTIIKFRNNTYDSDFLLVTNGDDPIFIRNCEKIIKNRINHWNPKELFVISMNTVFYSPSIENKRSFPEDFSFWSCNDELEVTRYIYDSSKTIFLRSYKGYEEKTDASYIKTRKREEYTYYDTSYGTREYKYKPIDDGLIIYYTKNTQSRDEGSIMFLYKSYHEYDTALVTLHKDMNWGISETCGILKSEIQ